MFQEILGFPDVDNDHADDKVPDNKEEGKGHKRPQGKGKQKAKESKGAAGFMEVEDESSRLMSAVLSGVNRALPFAKVAETTKCESCLEIFFIISTTNMKLIARSM